MERRQTTLALLALLLVMSAAGMATAQPVGGEGSDDQGLPVKQAKDLAGQVWEVVWPWVQRGVQWASSAGKDVAAVVWERASFQGVKSVVAEAGSIGFNFFTGRPYQGAYQVAKNVPVAGGAVKDVLGEANLRKQAAREQAEDNQEL